MKSTHFDVLRGPFVNLEQASRRVLEIIQNHTKIHLRSPQNKLKTIWNPISQWSKTHAVASPAKMHQNAFIVVVPGVALLTPWIEKTLKIGENHRKGVCEVSTRLLADVNKTAQTLSQSKKKIQITDPCANNTKQHNTTQSNRNQHKKQRKKKHTSRAEETTANDNQPYVVHIRAIFLVSDALLCWPGRE